jgi:hypothetical protein
VLPCHHPEELARRLQQLLHTPAIGHHLGALGRRRMGAAGGSQQIAALVEQRLLG